jgi:aminopeptidase N
MWRSLLAGTLMVALGVTLSAQERRSRIDVEHYVITAEVNPDSQTLKAEVQVRFTPLDDGASSATFELNDALSVSSVTDAGGQPLPAARLPQDEGIRVSFSEPLAKGKPVTLVFRYDGALNGSETSPIYGIKFASIQKDFAYLLYPARWFPISGYTTDRYTYEAKITVPAGNRVIASGTEKTEPAEAGNACYSFRTEKPAFPGSIAVVKGDPVRVSSEGVSASVFFRGPEAAVANAYGEESGKILGYLSSVYGAAPVTSLTLVETEKDAPNGYANEGILFLSPAGIGAQVNPRLLSNQIARLWWGTLVSPATRDHIWLTNGLARYSELLYVQQTAGAGAFEAELRDTFVEALTVDNPPLIQTGRMEDYSPEFWALTAGKGAAVLSMLKSVIGDENFTKLLKEFPSKFAWKEVTTADFRRSAEELAGADLQYFFREWLESNSAPEFHLEYTVFRIGGKGFRVVGKVTQDMDTFRMPIDIRIETDGNPEEKRVEVVGTSSEFSVESFGKPRVVTLDPNNHVLRMGDATRVAVAIRRGEQFAELGSFPEALKEYQKALEVNRNSSLALYRTGEVFFRQNIYQDAANKFREALNGDLEPKWIEVWSHINLGRIFDVTSQRERARNEFQLAIRTKDNTQGAQEEAAKYIDKPYQRQTRSDI